ncbi:hypothetical protein PTKIN_Ptkin16aG0490700 [Pterospermum kingtungense]
MAATTISLKLFIDPKSHRVLFAEAGKEFVDFLFLIQALPVGTVTSLLTKQEMAGCLGNLYHWTGIVESIDAVQSGAY